MPASPADLTTAAIVAGDLGVAADATIQRLVTAASRAIATFCGRTFERGTGIVEYPESVGRPFLLLARPPIVIITSIVDHGGAVAATDYECVGRNVEAGIVYRPSGLWGPTLRDAGRITADFLQAQGETTTRGLTVTYDGGWITPGQNALDGSKIVTLPEDVQEAAIQTAVALYRLRGTDQRVSSENLGDWSVSYFDSRGARADIPATAQTLLAGYVLMRVA